MLAREEPLSLAAGLAINRSAPSELAKADVQCDAMRFGDQAPVPLGSPLASGGGSSDELSLYLAAMRFEFEFEFAELAWRPRGGATVASSTSEREKKELVRSSKAASLRAERESALRTICALSPGRLCASR